MFELKTQTRPQWFDAVMADFDAFLLDHAACERKASAMGISFVMHYPDRLNIIDPLVAFAREELEHFHQVVGLCVARGLVMSRDEKDPYVTALLKWVRTGRDTRLLDRLLVAGVIEARGCERFDILARRLEDPELKAFYLDITRSEARHHGLFLRLARMCFDDAEIRPRLDDLLAREAEIADNLPLRAAVH